MKTEPIESNSSQGPSSDLDPTLVTLEYSIRQLDDAIRSSPAKPGDPTYGNVVDQQILLQASVAISHLRFILESDRLENSIAKNTNTNLIRAIALLERTRARIDRGEKTSARLALRKLELENKEQRVKPDRDIAVHFLQAELAQGERPARELIKSARELGISPRTLNRAKADMSIHCRLHHENKQRTWHWSLPNSELKQHAAHPASTSALESPGSPSPALVPPVSTGGKDHLPQMTTDDTPSLDPTTPVGPIVSIGPIAASLGTQNSIPSTITLGDDCGQNLRLPSVMATSQNHVAISPTPAFSGSEI